MFEPKVLWNQMCCIEESTCDIVGTFRRPGNCAFAPPTLRPWGTWLPSYAYTRASTLLPRMVWGPCCFELRVTGDPVVSATQSRMYKHCQRLFFLISYVKNWWTRPSIWTSNVMEEHHTHWNTS